MLGVERARDRRAPLKRRAERDRIIDSSLSEERCESSSRSVIGRSGKGGIAQPPAEIVRDVAVEIEPPLLDQPHHAERDDQLGDGRDPHRILDGQPPPRARSARPEAPTRGAAHPIEGRPGISGRRRLARRGAVAQPASKQQGNGQGARHHPASSFPRARESSFFWADRLIAPKGHPADEFSAAFASICSSSSRTAFGTSTSITTIDASQ